MSMPPSFQVPACVAPLASVGDSRKKALSVVTPLHSSVTMQVPSVPLVKLGGALSLKGESLVTQAPPIEKKPPFQSKVKATTTPPPDSYASRLLPSVTRSEYPQLLIGTTMSYCCN